MKQPHNYKKIEFKKNQRVVYNQTELFEENPLVGKKGDYLRKMDDSYSIVYFDEIGEVFVPTEGLEYEN